MVTGRTPARVVFGGDSKRFADGFVIALLLGMTAALAALLAGSMVGFGVGRSLPVGLLVTAVAGLAVLGALLYAGLGAGLLSAGAIAVSPYVGLLALDLVAGTFPFPISSPASDVRFFAIVGVGLALVGVGFHELPRLLGTSDASDT